MKKTCKLIVVLFIIVSILALGTIPSFAEGEGDDKASSTLAALDGNATFGAQTNINNLGNQIMTIVQTVGIITAVVILLILGIKYMMGSAEEKAEYKKTMIPYIIGAVLLFAASGLVGLLKTFSSTFASAGNDPTK